MPSPDAEGGRADAGGPTRTDHSSLDGELGRQVEEAAVLSQQPDAEEERVTVQLDKRRGTQMLVC